MKIFFLAGFLFLVSEAQAAFDPGQAFEKKCSACHTIGGGELKGPDLKGVSQRHTKEWLLKFIPSSSAMIASGDPVAVKLFNQYAQKEMPDQNLTNDEVSALLEFIDSGGAVAVSLNVKSALDATAEDKASGLALFLGQKPLAKGGPACVSCHSVGAIGALGGGTLAKNLTHTYSDFKDQGLSVALKKLAFPVMSEVFAGKELSDKEAFEIKAFLYEADLTSSATTNFQKKFAFLGLAGLVVAMGVIDFSWRRRRTKSVRRSKGGLR